MRTIGDVIKEARIKKKLSYANIEKETKIKKEFVRAIEKQQWVRLPEYPVVNGFVRSLSDVLGLDRKQTLAKLRRDYPPKSLRINPKPDVSQKIVWSPKFTFLAGVLVFSLIIISYLTYQYIDFISPPDLEVKFPEDGQVVTNKNLTVSGSTEPEAVIKINNQPVIVGQDGGFSTEIEIFEGTDEVEVKAISRSGKETTVHRNIKVELAQ